MRAPLRIAPLGSGAAGTLARVASDVPEVAVVDPDGRDDAVLLADPQIDAVWIGDPVPRHAERAVAALTAGKHAIVEKPMALTLADADAMIAAAASAGVQLLAGHSSYNYQLPIRAMRQAALEGSAGRPRAALIWSATDWMLRARPPEQADPHGAGLIHRQAPHQIETLRLLGLGRLQSVRAAAGAWMPQRDEPCFYTAHFTYDDGMTAAVSHNGNGYFMTVELYPEAERNHSHAAAAANVGAVSIDQPWSPVDLGMTILSCERGDLRHSGHGITIYGDDGRREIDLRGLMHARLRGHPDTKGGATVQALLELAGAAGGTAPLVHDGAWARATLEATLALLASAAGQCEVVLTQQTLLPPSFDAHLLDDCALG